MVSISDRPEDRGRLVLFHQPDGGAPKSPTTEARAEYSRGRRGDLDQGVQMRSAVAKIVFRALVRFKHQTAEFPEFTRLQGCYPGLDALVLAGDVQRACACERLERRRGSDGL